MTCREFERLLDQKAPDAETRAAMQRHAENCPECRLLLELRGLDAQEQVPEEAATRWRAAIRTEQARGETKGKGFIHSRAFAPVCAAAAVLVLNVVPVALIVLDEVNRPTYGFIGTFFGFAVTACITARLLKPAFDRYSSVQ